MRIHKNGIRAIVLIVLVAMTVFVCYRTLMWKSTADNHLQVYYQLDNTPKNTIDVVFVGSSHVYCGIYPSVLWRDYGIASFDLAVSAQDRQSAYYGLKELLKTQSPKVVMVDLYNFKYNVQEDRDNKYRNLFALKYSKNMIDLVNHYDAEENLDKKPFYTRFPIIHTRYKSIEKYDFKQNKANLYCKGEYYTWNTVAWSEGAEDGYSKTEERYDLDAADLQWLQNMKELSEEKGFEIIFMVLPAGLEDYIQRPVNSVSDWAEKNGVAFYDFNKRRSEIDLLTGDNYYDYNHLNGNGAEKVSRYIYENILSKYGLKDHRNNPLYKSWDFDVKQMEHELSAWKIEHVDNIENCLEVLAESEDIVIVYDLADGMSEEANYTEILSKYGLDVTSENGEQYWICVDNKLCAIDKWQAAKGYNLDLSDTDTLHIDITKSNPQERVMLNSSAEGGSGTGLCILAYDKFLERKVAHLEF